MKKEQILKTGAAEAHAVQPGGQAPPPAPKPSACGKDADFTGRCRHGDLARCSRHPHCLRWSGGFCLLDPGKWAGYPEASGHSACQPHPCDLEDVGW